MQREHQMLAFLSEVRDMVVPRLPTEEMRVKALMPVVRWQPRDEWNRLTNRIFYGTEGCDLGVTSIHKDGMIPYCITLHSDDLSTLKPFGEWVAFVMIHETAHAATAGHNHDEIWASMCRVMGIDEKAYSGEYKTGDKITYGFLDGSLLLAIRNLSIYPGDTA